MLLQPHYPNHHTQREKEREERVEASRRWATATSGARPSHDRDPGRKREKERRSERPRKRVRGGVSGRQRWQWQSTTRVFDGLESSDCYEPRKNLQFEG